MDESGTRVSGYVAAFQIDGPLAVNTLVELKFREQITPRGAVPTNDPQMMEWMPPSRRRP